MCTPQLNLTTSTFHQSMPVSVSGADLSQIIGITEHNISYNFTIHTKCAKRQSLLTEERFIWAVVYTCTLRGKRRLKLNSKVKDRYEEIHLWTSNSLSIGYMNENLGASPVWGCKLMAKGVKPGRVLYGKPCMSTALGTAFSLFCEPTQLN